MKVVFTEEARANMFAIGDYIARDNPLRALTFLDELEDRCLNLKHHPHAYPVLSRRPLSGIRRLVHGNYNVFYTVAEHEVHILYVMHGAMDYEKILFPEE